MIALRKREDVPFQMNCVICGVEFTAYRSRRRYCDRCKVDKFNEWRRAETINRYRVCIVCHRRQRKRDGYSRHRHPQRCDDCVDAGRVANANGYVDPAWLGPYRRETDPYLREIQKLGSCACFRCVHVDACKITVRTMAILPCECEGAEIITDQEEK